MKLFLATDAVDDVRWATQRALIDGVVLPDSALRGAASTEASLHWLSDFANAVQTPVFVSLDATTAESAAEDAELLGRAGDQVVIQLPFTEPFIPLIHRLALGGVKVAATFVGSAAQAMLAARTGAAFVFVDVDRIDAGGGDGANVIRQSRALLDGGASDPYLVAVFPGAGASIVSCGLAGADAVVVGAASLRAMIAYPFSDQSLIDPSRRPVHGERLRVAHS